MLSSLALTNLPVTYKEANRGVLCGDRASDLWSMVTLGRAHLDGLLREAEALVIQRPAEVLCTLVGSLKGAMLANGTHKQLLRKKDWKAPRKTSLTLPVCPECWWRLWQ